MPKYPPAPRKVLERDYSYEEKEKPFDVFTLIFEHGPSAIDTARGVRRDLAESYRKFLVGATAISIDGIKRRAAIFAAANWKPDAHAQKKCAEMGAVGYARKHFSDSGVAHTPIFVPGVFVAGTTNRQEIKAVTGLATPTLHPCKPCRSLLDEGSVVVSFGADQDLFEAYTGQELWQMYAEPDPYNKKSLSRPGIRAFEVANFALAREIYTERAKEILEAAPEPVTRVVRAGLVIDALYEASA